MNPRIDPRARARVCAALLLLGLAAGVGDARTEVVTTPAPQTRVLRVATGSFPPFVLKEGDELTGFSVDLWHEIARRLKLEFEWVYIVTRNGQVQAVARGEADVAISAIVMTPATEQIVDFSTGYFDSGLRIMVPAEAGPSLPSTFRAVASSILEIAAAALALLFLLANLLWLVERRTNASFQKGYMRGILEGCWGVMLIVATGEYGDRETPNVVRRLAVVGMWLFGVVLIAQFTAMVTSSLTVQHLRSAIEGPADLPGKRIGSFPGSVAAAYLTHRGIPFTDVNNVDETLDALTRDTVQAVVFDAPTLEYWAAHQGRGLVQVVGPVFRPEKYGIAVALESPLRKRINDVLHRVYADGTFDQIRSKWFPVSR